ncbi:MAG: hypothetical protein INF43_00215 [Alphaproteobacteria bacterium]|nr:hypothetical protein [Alphaproteobacteria bacterium]
MTLKTIAFTAFVATTALAGIASAQEFNKEQVCAEQKDANLAALTAARAARPDAAAVKAVITEAAGRVVGNNICLADLLTDADADIAAILAETADSGDIAPAAGPEGETPAFGGGDATPTPENPGQLNTPVTGAPASPASPAL